MNAIEFIAIDIFCFPSSHILTQNKKQNFIYHKNTGLAVNYKAALHVHKISIIDLKV